MINKLSADSLDNIYSFLDFKDQARFASVSRFTLFGYNNHLIKMENTQIRQAKKRSLAQTCPSTPVKKSCFARN